MLVCEVTALDVHLCITIERNDKPQWLILTNKEWQNLSRSLGRLHNATISKISTGKRFFKPTRELVKSCTNEMDILNLNKKNTKVD